LRRKGPKDIRVKKILSVLSIIAGSLLPITVSNTTAQSIRTSASGPVNVFFIVLDEAPLFAIVKKDGTINEKRFPGFAELARHTTWYRNTLTTAQRTTEAVPALLDGKWPTVRNYPVFQDHPNNLFSIFSGKRKISQYQPVTKLCPPDTCRNVPVDNSRSVPLQVSQFRSGVKEAASATEPTLIFRHVLLPHRPWLLSVDLRISNEIGADPRTGHNFERRRDSYQGMLRQYVATDKLITEMLRTMKKSPNWNKTMLIVTADHGLTFVPGQSERIRVNPNSTDTLEDLYRVPLFIKYPGQSTPAVNDCPISSIDVLPTILNVAEIPHKDTFDGVDISTSCPQRESRTVAWPYSKAKISTGTEALLERVRYYDAWIPSDGNVTDIFRIGRSAQLLGTTVPKTAAIRKDIAWTLFKGNSFKKIGQGELTYVPTKVSGFLKTTSPICAACEGLIVADRRVVGILPELADLQPSAKKQYFTSALLTRYITPKTRSVELWIADWSTGTATFAKVGAPQIP
jgi:hypothetical protein